MHKNENQKLLHKKKKKKRENTLARIERNNNADKHALRGCVILFRLHLTWCAKMATLDGY